LPRGLKARRHINPLHRHIATVAARRLSSL
jgi:hypothetical protein